METSGENLFRSVRAAEPVFWQNPHSAGVPVFSFSAADVEDAEARLRRFAPWIMLRFPETAAHRNGRGAAAGGKPRVLERGAALSL